MISPEITEEGEEITCEKIIYYRQYLPEWIDSDMWLTPEGKLLPSDPPPKYIYDWGRKATYHAQEYKVTRWQDMNIPKRPLREDPYEQFNKQYAQAHPYR